MGVKSSPNSGRVVSLVFIGDEFHCEIYLDDLLLAAGGGLDERSRFCRTAGHRRPRIPSLGHRVEIISMNILTGEPHVFENAEMVAFLNERLYGHGEMLSQ